MKRKTGLVLAANVGTIDELRAKLVAFMDSAKAIKAKAASENRDLTDAENAEIDACFASFEKTEAQIKRMETLEALDAKTAGIQPRASAPLPTVSASQPNRFPKGQNEFESMGHFALAVKASVRGAIDPRIMAAAPSSYGSEGINPDGGFAVPPDFRDAIVKMILGEESVFGRTDQVPIAGTSVTFPTDENAPWASGGVTAYWENEAAQHTPSKPALGELTCRAHKLAALVPVTDELMQDAPSMASYLTAKAAEKIDFKINDAIINGNGIGMPKGLNSAACKVTVAKEAGQTAATVNFQNVIKMWARLYAPCRANAVWLVHQDVETQLQAMTFPTAAGTNVAPLMPPGGISGAPYATMYGRPVLVNQSCQALGTEGDIILTDLKKYLTVTKGGLRQDISMHLWFDYDITAFRFVIRLGGQSWWSAAVSPKNGSSTLSPIVTLAVRA